MSNEKLAAEIIIYCRGAKAIGNYPTHQNVYLHFGNIRYNQTVKVVEALTTAGVFQSERNHYAELRLA